MKELSVEEKAKRYDKALEIINDYYQKIKYSSLSNASTDREVLERAFSELKDSKDEKIKKRIIALVNAHGQGMYKDEMLAWLEKQVQKLQGKSALEAAKEEKVNNQNCVKPADKVEPKFKVDNWIVYKNDIWKVCNISLQNYYELLKINNEVSTRLIKDVDEDAHLWTIQDAKDCDVLSYENEIFIVKKSVNLNIIYYCCYDREHFIIDSIYSLTIDDIDNIRPATKEQHDTLMKAMAKAGYIFDFEKKELRKIKQKNAWSEEDERMYRGLHNLIYSTPYCDSRKELSDWLKSIKDVVQTQPKQEWKQENIGDLDGFEIVMMQIGSSFFGKNAGLDPNDTNAIKEQANILLGLVQKQE